MKIRILYFILPVLIGCTKDFGKINTDPKKGSSVAPGEQLAAAAYFLDGGRETGYPNLLLLQPMVQYINGTTGMGYGSKYIRNDFYNTLMWDIYYSKSIKQLADLIEKNKTDTAQINYIAAARVLKVYIFSLLTDAFGDIPYSQAGMAYYNKIYTPQYDYQQDIYNSFFNELDTAILQFDDRQLPILNDIVYNGAIIKWKRLAASLQLRLGMRISAANPAKAKAEVQAAIAAGVMQSADDNFKMLHENYAYPDLRGNGYAQALQEEETYRHTSGCATFVNYLKAENDPRLGSFFVNFDENDNDITAITHYIPIKPGLYFWEQVEDFTGTNGVVIPHAYKYCTINKPFYQLQSPFLHMGYAEVRFLLAEAAARGWTGDNANIHYQEGIRAAMAQLLLYPGMNAVSEQAINDFVTAHPLTAEHAIEKINMQKWVALFPNGFEAYANQRRTGFPVLAPIVDVNGESETGGVLPKRLLYPAAEALNNPVHYQEALNRMEGKDDRLRRVWWNQ
ncbi:Starch-binding associating with outer membrane [Chitinophaga sp. CF118]|uniref:SusD/RagB family nutrient-binding outer membrane lipoprotein n=1 Tax=Chitinophaga sp. CF118 TaxID=1884367 RepID=UPI0008E73A86|nr:SusD/RagB family nutrient-binding outer membrane lipoprotein [Chitinophaga sp. CF118]SFF01167.1 Starch-binding associating with outer membrane [Chitinophaga sp. CF118]